MINHVALVGNISNEPELKGSESKALRFNIAIDEYAGKDSKRTNFLNCVIFGKRAEALSNILKKGMQIAIDGSLRSSTYEKDGAKRYSVDVICNEIVLPPKVD